MTFSQADTEKIAKELHEEFGKHSQAKDAKGLTGMYHPDAVLIHQGNWVVYGLDDILKKNEEIVQMPFDNFEIKQKTPSASCDGQYLFMGGTFTDKTDASKNGWYEQIYKRGDNGKYLVYHDIFHM